MEFQSWGAAINQSDAGVSVAGCRSYSLVQIYVAGCSSITIDQSIFFLLFSGLANVRYTMSINCGVMGFVPLDSHFNDI